MKQPKLLAVSVFSLFLILCLTLSAWQTKPSIGKGIQDTTKEKKGSYSRKTIITFDEVGKPHEQIIENYEGDEGMRELLRSGTNFNFNMPALSDLSGLDFAMPPLPPMDFDFDSFPDLSDRNDLEELEGLSEEMEALMQQRFRGLGPEFEEQMAELEKELSKLNFDVNHNFGGFDKDFAEKMEKLGAELGEKFSDLDNQFQSLDGLKEFGSKMRAFENEVRHELETDGYLGKGEDIESMQWNDDEIKFNGKKVKSEHLMKYKELHEKHWRHHKSGRHQE